MVFHWPGTLYRELTPGPEGRLEAIYSKGAQRVGGGSAEGSNGPSNDTYPILDDASEALPRLFCGLQGSFKGGARVVRGSVQALRRS